MDLSRRIATGLKNAWKRNFISSFEYNHDPIDLLPDHAGYTNPGNLKQHFAQEVEPHRLEFDGFDHRPQPRFASHFIAMTIYLYYFALLFTSLGSIGASSATWSMSAIELTTAILSTPLYSYQWFIVMLVLPGMAYAIYKLGVLLVLVPTRVGDWVCNLFLFFFVLVANLYLKIHHSLMLEYTAEKYWPAYEEMHGY